MVFDLNNQAEPQLVLKTDALSLNNSEFNPWLIKRFRGDISIIYVTKKVIHWGANHLISCVMSISRIFPAYISVKESNGLERPNTTVFGAKIQILSEQKVRKYIKTSNDA